MTAPAAPATGLLVACLCAAWCRLCDSYRSTWAQVAARHPQHRFVYVDVEDDADLVQAVDVENFPTLLIAEGRVLRFLGEITPQPETLERLVRAAQAGALPAPRHGLDPAALQQLLQGLDERAWAAK